MSTSYEDVLGRLTAYLEENLEEKPTQPVTADSSLQHDLKLDSIQSFEMVADLEDHYDISISLESFQDVVSVGDVARLVVQTLG